MTSLMPNLPAARCTSVDPEWFHPVATPGRGGRDKDADLERAVGRARGVCAPCPERAPCLSWALANDVDGIWAGTTTDERKAYRRANGVKPIRLVLGLDKSAAYGTTPAQASA